jgi:hypothetical protein
MNEDFVSVMEITEDCDEGVGGAPPCTNALIPAIDGGETGALDRPGGARPKNFDSGSFWVGHGIRGAARLRFALLKVRHVNGIGRGYRSVKWRPTWRWGRPPAPRV